MMMELGDAPFGPLYKAPNATRPAPIINPEDDYCPSDDNDEVVTERRLPTTRNRGAATRSESDSSSSSGSPTPDAAASPVLSLPDIDSRSPIAVSRHVDSEPTTTSDLTEASQPSGPGDTPVAAVGQETTQQHSERARSGAEILSSGPAASVTVSTACSSSEHHGIPAAVAPSADANGLNTVLHSSGPRAAAGAVTTPPEAQSTRAVRVEDPSFEGLPEAAAWIKPIYAKFAQEEVVPAYQPAWKQLLNCWVAVERAMGFQYAVSMLAVLCGTALTKLSQRSGFTPLHRPVEVEDWIKRARKPRFAVVQTDTFPERWTKWWSLCNPEWRVRDASGHPEKGGRGDWSLMLKPGPNGFVLIVGALVGLSIAAEENVWARSMHDVLWVLQEVLTSQEG